MSTGEILLQLLIGGLLGLVGQILRFAVGYKKMNDEASKTQKHTKDLFVFSTLVSSLLIGFAAGILAMASISTFDSHFLDSDLRQKILTLIASGYAGTDFIEGFVKRYIPNSNTAGEAPTKGATPQPQ